MKLALLVEKNRNERDRLREMLRWLGFMSAPVNTPEQALNVADAISFDIIVTSTTTRSNDRRALTSELQRLAPDSSILLVTSDEDDYREARAGRFPGVSAALRQPATMDAMRRIIQFGADGLGLHPVAVSILHERRRRAG